MAATRPLISPELFSGECCWTDWVDHFEAAATVNELDDSTKLKWLPVCLTGKAQVAWRCLSTDAKGNYDTAKEALCKRFKPDSKRQRYAAEFHSRQRCDDEKWGDYADQLRCLADKGFPTLEEVAREVLAVDRYLSNIADPSIAFAVRQKMPEMMEEAVAATLEMESYSTQCVQEKEKNVSLVEEATEHDMCMVRSQQNVILLLEAMVSRLEKLESVDDAMERRHEKGNSSFLRGKRQGKERTQSVRCSNAAKKFVMQGGVP